MDRKSLAIEMFYLLKNDDKLMKKDIELWQAIACTDDLSLLSEYEALKGGVYNGRKTNRQTEWQTEKTNQPKTV